MTAAESRVLAPSDPLLVVLLADSLCGFLAGVPGLRALRRAYPRHHLTALAPAWSAPLLLASSLADSVRDPAAPERDGSGPQRPLPPRRRRHPGASAPRGRALPPRRADVAADLSGPGPRGPRLLLASRPRRLIAFAHPLVAETALLPRHVPGTPLASACCALLVAYGVPADERETGLTLPPGAPKGNAGTILIHPGSRGDRRWPPGRFAAVGRMSIAPGQSVVVTGWHRELDVALEVACRADLSPAAVVVVGAGSPGEPSRDAPLGILGALAAARAVLTGDPGIARLAMALDTPSVLVAGPDLIGDWAPSPDAGRHRALCPGWVAAQREALEAEDPGFLEVTVASALEALEGAAGALPRRQARIGRPRERCTGWSVGGRS